MQNNSLPNTLAMRPREAAKAIGISERTLWSWTHNNEIPHIRMGKAILYPVDALRRWLESRVVEQRGRE
jgi:excisionase family DNA binding protein